MRSVRGCVCVGMGTGWLLVIFGADTQTPEHRVDCAQLSLSATSLPPFLSVCQRFTVLFRTRRLGREDGDAGGGCDLRVADESTSLVVGVSRAVLPARRSAILTSAGCLDPDVMAMRLL